VRRLIELVQHVLKRERVPLAECFVRKDDRCEKKRCNAERRKHMFPTQPNLPETETLLAEGQRPTLKV